MGKSLVIKGADFSANALTRETLVLSLAQGTIAGSTSGNPGDWDFSSGNYNAYRVKSARNAGIFVESGQRIELTGLTGLGYGYFPYNQNEPTTANVLDASYRQEHPTLNSENNNVVTWTNNTGQDVYIWFIFKWLGTDGVHADGSAISPSDVNISYRVY